MNIRIILASLLAAAVSLPAVALGDEGAIGVAPEAADYYSGLEDLSLRKDITSLGQYYFVGSENTADAAGGFAAEIPLLDGRGGSSGGYVNFGSPATSAFLGMAPENSAGSFLDGVEFGVDWRPDVSGAQNSDYRTLVRSLSGGEFDRVGVRADLTALLRDELDGDSGSTVWRITGMLGSTSLSLLSNDDLSSDAKGGGLLWDIGVGWSSGAVSVNAGYQSVYSLAESAADGSDLAVLSLGAGYVLMPGFSIYGEFNVVDGLFDESDEGRGTVVILGTEVSF